VRFAGRALRCTSWGVVDISPCLLLISLCKSLPAKALQGANEFCELVRLEMSLHFAEDGLHLTSTELYGENHMNRRTQMIRARMAACANYWRIHIAIRQGCAARYRANLPAMQGRRPLHTAKPAGRKPGTAA